MYVIQLWLEDHWANTSVLFFDPESAHAWMKQNAGLGKLRAKPYEQ